MTNHLVKILLLSSAIGLAAGSVARADCESDLVQLEAAYATPNLTPVQKSALDEAKPIAVAALKKDDDAKCHIAIAESLTKAGIKAAAPSSATASLSTGHGLGDLSSYKAIAQDTLKIVNAKDITTARTRIRDLEVAWDNAEADMRPRDETNWTTFDVAIDDALAAVRTPNADNAECVKTLQALIAAFEAAKKS